MLVRLKDKKKKRLHTLQEKNFSEMGSLLFRFFFFKQDALYIGLNILRLFKKTENQVNIKKVSKLKKESADLS